jgi:hypothetical protein
MHKLVAAVPLAWPLLLQHMQVLAMLQHPVLQQNKRRSSERSKANAVCCNAV